MPNNIRRFFVTLLCLAPFGVASALAASQQPPLPPARYAPPEATFSGTNQLQLLQSEIDQKHFDTASTRLDTLLRDSADALMSQGDDASILSRSTWVQNLPTETKNALRPSYETAIGQTAQQAVDEIQARPDADPAEIYGLAKRYPLARASVAALAEAARRNALLGDVPAARWMINAAVAGGWSADPTLKHAIDETPAQPALYGGPLPFQASWYGLGTRRAWSALRIFPTAGAGVIFIVAPAQVIAINDSGAVLWKGPGGAEPSAGRGAPATIGVTRGPSFSPAVLCDAAGAPQLLVVRQPEIHGDGWALRALRAQDGHLLWTTEGQDDYHGLVFGSNAAIEGRYVYAIAGELSDQLDHLFMVAIEATTGRQLWRCDIGTVSRTVITPRPKNLPTTEVFRPWLNESAPAVAGDQVIASPNVGAVIAVDRFDGKLQWTRSYQTLADPTLVLARQKQFAIEHPASMPPLASGVSMRWSNTPAIDGDAIVAAPQDSDLVLAMNIHDGKSLWQSPGMPEATLLGVAEGIVVMAGEQIAGLNLHTGETSWTSADSGILGPSVIHGSTVLAPVGKGLIGLSAKDGSTVPVAERVPPFETAIATEPAHGVLLANDAAHCFRAKPDHNDHRSPHAGPSASP